jgi:acylaminoacyl-peptidase
MELERRTQLIVPVLPGVAASAPHRIVYVGSAGGCCQLFAWDRRTGDVRQLTDRADGTVGALVDPTGTAVWWFDDDLAGNGTWRISDFDAPGPAVEALPGAPAARHAGLAMAADGTAAIGLSDADGLTLHLRSRAGRSAPVGRIRGYAQLVDLDPTGRLITVGTDAAAADAVTVLTTTGERVARLSGGAGGARARGVAAGAGAGGAVGAGDTVDVGGRVWALGFAPGAGEPRLLLIVEDRGEYLLATWTEAGGLTRSGWCRFDTEITASWYPDGRRVLVRQDRHAGSLLHTVDLDGRRRVPVRTPAGSILDAAVWPDGDLAYVWSDAATPPSLCSASGMVLPAGSGDPIHATAGRRSTATGSAQAPTQYRRERWVRGPGGRSTPDTPRASSRCRRSSWSTGRSSTPGTSTTRWG